MANNVIEIRENKVLDFDDVLPFLSPVQSNDLERILRITASKNRIETAMAFSGLNKKELFFKAGVIQDWDNEKHYITRWLNKETRLPLGVAFRVARVFNIPCELLFEFYI